MCRGFILESWLLFIFIVRKNLIYFVNFFVVLNFFVFMILFLCGGIVGENFVDCVLNSFSYFYIVILFFRLF